MKRIKAACIEQTIHFFLKEEPGLQETAEAVRNEVARYKSQLDRSRTRYRIVTEMVQPDGSVILKIKKQYNYHDCGDYLA